MLKIHRNYCETFCLRARELIEANHFDYLIENWSTLWSYVMPGPLFSKAARGWQCLVQFSQTLPHVTVLQTTSDCRVCCSVSEDSSQNHRRRPLCLYVWQSWSPCYERCPGILNNTLLRGLALNQGNWSEYTQIKGIEVSTSLSSLFAGGITRWHVFYVVSRVFL